MVIWMRIIVIKSKFHKLFKTGIYKHWSKKADLHPDDVDDEIVNKVIEEMRNENWEENLDSNS